MSKQSSLENVSIDEQVELHKLLYSAPQGEKNDVMQSIMAKYNISARTVYRWKFQLERRFNNKENAMAFMTVKATSTMLDAEGKVKLQWVKENVDENRRLEALKEAFMFVIDKVEPINEISAPTVDMTMGNICNMYICNDLHIGALMSKSETHDRNWDTKIALSTIKSSIDFLLTASVPSEYALIADLGDLLEIDDFKNATPKSGNALDVDGRYSKVITVAMEAMVYMIEKALEKHRTVKFVNISGNHDITTGHAIRAFIKAWFRSNPRVIIDESALDIKYHLHGSTLIGMAHGDGLSMSAAGEVMVVDNEKIISSTKNRYFHFGHTHKDSVHDGRLCRSESHRNLAPLNNWASHKGYRRQAGTMKCISYHTEFGEVSRTTFNIGMLDEE